MAGLHDKSNLPATAGTTMALLATGLRNLFFALACTIAALFIYTFYVDGHPFRTEFFSPWMPATLIDIYVNIFAVAVWVVYKEPDSVNSAIWVVLLMCLGGLTTCTYIFIQFLKLSPEESTEDPIYHVLLRHDKKNVKEAKNSKYSPVVVARIVFNLLGCLVISSLIYSVVTDGSPFHKEVLTQWLSTTVIEFYIIVVAISVWVAYKETSWLSASIWIVLLICLGSVGTCAYIARQLSRLSSEDPIYLILFKRNKRRPTGVPLLSSV